MSIFFFHFLFLLFYGLLFLYFVNFFVIWFFFLKKKGRYIRLYKYNFNFYPLVLFSSTYSIIFFFNFIFDIFIIYDYISEHACFVYNVHLVVSHFIFVMHIWPNVFELRCLGLLYIVPSPE